MANMLDNSTKAPMSDLVMPLEVRLTMDGRSVISAANTIRIGRLPSRSRILLLLLLDIVVVELFFS
jgi:hypothetical protein